MILEIDHVLVAARDPDGAAADLSASLGLVAAGGGVHEAIGTRNALLSLGGPYLELIGLLDSAPETRARALRHPIGSAVARALDDLAAADLARDGDAADAAAAHARYAYVTVALRSDDAVGEVARLAARGLATGVMPREVVRRRPDGTAIRWPVAFPARLGPDEAPFLIEHAPGESERAARLAAGGPRLHGLDVRVADPAATAGHWAAAWGLVTAGPPAPGSSGETTVSLSVGPHEVVLAGSRRGAPAAIVRLVDPPGGGPRVVDRGGVVIAVG